VLTKRLELGFPIIVVINKIDRQEARPNEVHSEIFDLFVDLGASDAQADFPLLYAIGREGLAKRSLDDSSTSLQRLFGTVLERLLEKILALKGDCSAPLQFIVNSVDHDDYVGRLAIGRVASGTVRANQPVGVLKDGTRDKAQIKVLSSFEGLKRVATQEAT